MRKALIGIIESPETPPGEKLDACRLFLKIQELRPNGKPRFQRLEKTGVVSEKPRNNISNILERILTD